MLSVFLTPKVSLFQGYCHDAIDNARYLANHDVCMSAIGVQDDPETPDVNEAAGATTDIGCEHRNVVSCP